MPSPSRPRPDRTAAGAVTVNAYSASWLRRGFSWVYPAEVLGGRPAPGERVRVRAEDGTPLGQGIADDGWIAVRLLAEADGDFETGLTRRVQAALSRRIPVDSTARRLVNAENDDLPGIRVDDYAGHAVITLDSPSLDAVVPLVQKVLDAPSLVATYRRDPRDAGKTPVTRAVAGDDPGEIEVVELGLRYAVRPAMGKDAGLFTDMRELRRWLAPWWTGRRVLNLFAHTGAFSVSAAAHGALRVDSVDLSGPHLARARRNFELNSLDALAHGFWTEDGFKALDRLRRTGQLHDVVVVDPPGYSRSEEGSWQGEKDWPRLAAACLRVLSPGGWLVACSNLGTQSPRQFAGALSQGAERAGRRLRVVHEACPPPDHPAALHFPESHYLKAWVVGVD